MLGPPPLTAIRGPRGSGKSFYKLETVEMNPPAILRTVPFERQHERAVGRH